MPRGTALLLFLLLTAWASGQQGAPGGKDDGGCMDSDGQTDAQCVLSGLDSEEALERAFAAGAVEYSVKHALLTPLRPPAEREVTLCTQGSMDRLARLEEQAAAWPGPLSAAVYVRHDEYLGEERRGAVGASLSALHARVEALGSCRLTLSLVVGVDPARAAEEFDTLYPINALRNVAVANARTDLIMVIDVDFVPSEGFHEYLSEPERYERMLVQAAEKRVWALVSFEVHEDWVPPPRTLPALAECLKNRSVVVAEAYLNPTAHEPVSIEEWLVAEGDSGPLPQEGGYEPFVLGGRGVLPWYDERFRGYGFDKTAHAVHLRAVGFEYRMLPRHFVIARYHQPTPTAVRVFGVEPDELLRTRMEWLFERACAEIREAPAHFIPQASTATTGGRGG